MKCVPFSLLPAGEKYEISNPCLEAKQLTDIKTKEKMEKGLNLTSAYMFVHLSELSKLFRFPLM